MKAKSSKFFKIIAFLLCFFLCIEQSGFAQIAGQLDISGHLANLRNAFSPDVFRPLHLRYLSYNPLENNFQLFLDKGSLKNPNPQELQDTTKMLLNYFFIGIALPNDIFWVNLRPDAEDNIIDEQLAQTDVGKILLESDLQLKKDTARFTSPETHEGREYWDKLYQKAGEIFGSSNITIPTLTRPWIVPDEIIIRETPDSAYIYKATLKVMLEQDYLKDSAVYNFKDDSLKELNEYSSKLIREIIIPKLTKEINSSKRYASLRQVYYSLIMAQWFKARHYGKDGLYAHLIDKKDLTNLTSKENWSKTTYFKEYQKSFKEGEYNIKEPVYTPYGQTIRSYFSGGMELNISIQPFGSVNAGSSPVSTVVASISPVARPNEISMNIQGTPELATGIQAASSPIIKDGQGKTDGERETPSVTEQAISPLQAFLESTPNGPETLEHLRELGINIDEVDEYIANGIRDNYPQYKMLSFNSSSRLFPWEMDIIKAFIAQVKQRTINRPSVQAVEPQQASVQQPAKTASGRIEEILSSGNVREVIKMLKDNPVTRVEIANVLIAVLREYGHSESPRTVVASAEQVVYQTQDLLPETIDVLIEILDDPTVCITHRRIAALALGNFKSEKVRSALNRHLDDKGFGVKQAVRQVLGIPEERLPPQPKPTTIQLEAISQPQVIITQVTPEETKFLSIVNRWAKEKKEGWKLSVIQELRNNGLNAHWAAMMDIEKILQSVRWDGPYRFVFRDDKQDNGWIIIELPNGEFSVVAVDPAFFVTSASDYIFERIFSIPERVPDNKRIILFNPYIPTIPVRLKRIHDETYTVLRRGVLSIQGGSPAQEPTNAASSPTANLPGIPLSFSMLNDGFKVEFQGKQVHVRGIYPDERPIHSYITALQQRTSNGKMVVPRVLRVYLPFMKLDTGSSVSLRSIITTTKDESQLPTETKTLLHQASALGLFELIELNTKQEYMQAADELGLDGEKFFSAMIQTNHLIFISDWIGPNVAQFIATHMQDEELLRKLGAGLGQTLRTLHKGGIIAGDTDLKQFVVRGNAEEVLRIDLVNIYSLGEVGQENIGFEFNGIANQLQMYTSIMFDAFGQGYHDASSPVRQDKLPISSSLQIQNQTMHPGGIDFRTLPIVTQAITNLSGMLRESPLRGESLMKVNLNEEWQEIERMANSGITPSSERIKEYIQTSCAQDSITQDRDKILLCISDILRLEEERCDHTDTTLRDILVVLESMSNAQELRQVFLGKVI